MLIDLHAHTSLESWDSTLTPDELVEGAKAAGLDGLCLTEHDQFWDLRRAEELAKRHDFTIIPGCEITTEEGHVLVFGIDSYVYGMHRVPFLREYVDRAGGVLLVVHPLPAGVHRRERTVVVAVRRAGAAGGERQRGLRPDGGRRVAQRTGHPAAERVFGGPVCVHGSAFLRGQRYPRPG